MAAFLRFAACAALCGALPFEGGAAPFEGAAPLDGAAPFEGGAPALDGAASLEGAASLDGAAVMVLPLGCEHFPGTCNTLQPFWLAVSKAVHVSTLSCASSPRACETALSRPVEPGVEPIFELRSPSGPFRRYAGAPDPRSLLDAVVEAAGGAGEEGGGVDEEAYEAAYEAAESYVGRRLKLQKALELSERGAFAEARKIYADYLSQWPRHPNAVAGAAQAAARAGDLPASLALWDRLVSLEPRNARLLAGAADVLLGMGRFSDAATRLQLALATSSAKTDATLRRQLEAMLAHCRGEVVEL